MLLMKYIFPIQMVFATDVQSRSFLQLPKPAGVDFRASYVTLVSILFYGYLLFF